MDPQTPKSQTPKSQDTASQNPASWILSQRSAMANDLIGLCNINSGSENVGGLLRAADWLEEAFSVLKVPCNRQALPSYTLVDDGGVQAALQTGPALIWEIGASADAPAVSPSSPGCLWTIHYDTVYGPEEPFQFCEHLPENRLRGPGVIDAKGGIIVMLYAARLAQKFLDLSKLRLTLVLTPDEEIGSPSSLTLWNRIAPEYANAFLFEPAMSDGSLVQARKGTGTFIFVVRGKSAHAGRNFHEGRNAILQACRIAEVLDQHNGKRPNVTINIGRLRGGNAVNVVPETAVLRVNVRVSSAEDQAWIESVCKQTAENFCDPEKGFRVELHGGIHAPPKIVDEATKRLQSCVESAGKSLGQQIQWKESGGASDGNKLQGLGIANLDTFGPRGDALHSHNEWIALDSLPEKALLAFESLRELYFK